MPLDRRETRDWLRPGGPICLRPNPTPHHTTPLYSFRELAEIDLIKIVCSDMDVCQKDAVKRVAIIGGGFGGCSTAYFLRRLLGNRISITVFERSERVGGRVRSIYANNGKELYETGGSLYTCNDKYMKMFVDRFSLIARRHPPSDEAFSLYQGRSNPVFSSTAGPLFINRLRFAFVYGLDFVRFQYCVRKHVKALGKIYDLQSNGQAFTSPVTMLKALSPEFPKMLKSTFAKWLDLRCGISARFCEEVVYGLTSLCYCSGLTLHAFAGMCAVSGFGADLFSVVGGNEQISQKLCEAALAESPNGVPNKLSLNTEVTKLDRSSKRSLSCGLTVTLAFHPRSGVRVYMLTYKRSGIEKCMEFDFVVLAFPMHEKSPTTLTLDSDLRGVFPVPKKYAEVDYTLFRGDLEAAEYGLPVEKVKSDGTNGVAILPTYRGYEVEKGTLFKYLGRAWSMAPYTGQRVGCWSTYSSPRRTNDPGRQILEKYVKGHGSVINSTRWFAYPIFSTVSVKYENLEDAVEKFLLDDGLIYANALESVASNMEMAIVGGYNAALLIAHSKDFDSQDNL
uniref:Prenylcys_lyase domain-containing protein n=1 Tax=Mesocestoides corti TaxID=53468 RepID=A0A5K3F300_MESCO